MFFRQYYPKNNNNPIRITVVYKTRFNDEKELVNELNFTQNFYETESSVLYARINYLIKKE